MRRTTLGPVSSSQLNKRPTSLLSNPSARVSMGPAKTLMARQSVGPVGGAISRRVSTASHGARRPPAAPRGSVSRQSVSSMAATGITGRRSSTYGSRGSIPGRGRMPDPRPIGDKMFLNSCIQALVEFLTDRMYDQSLSPKLLMRGPSKKDYCSIIQFLFKQVDPTFEFGAKFEEDVVAQFRNLRYPFSITKTSLSSVGTPHTWPTILLSISWLIELLSYDEVIQRASILDEDDGENGDKPFFKYLESSYRVFLAGEDEQFALLEQQEKEKHATRNQTVQQETDELEKQQEALKKRIEQAKIEKSALPELNQKKVDCLSDLEKFKALVARLERHQVKVEKAIDQLGGEREQLEEQLVARQQEIQRLNVRIDNQDLSAQDIDRMSKERARLNDQCHQVAERQKDTQSKMWHKESHIAQQGDNLENLVQKYSAICTRLKLLPTMARNARGVDYDIVLDAHTGGVEAAEKLSAYLKQHIRPSAKRFKEERVRRGNTALDEALQLQEHVQRNSEILSLETQKERNWEAQVKKLDDALRREREVREEAIAQKQAATEDVELKMESIRNEHDSAAEEIQTQKHLAEVKQASAVMIETYRSLLDKNRHEVANVLMACTTHKAMIDRAITSLENEIDSLEL